MEQVSQSRSMSNIGYYYLGLLPNNMDKKSLLPVLNLYGQPLRLRLPKQKDLCEYKGYGYVVIDLRVPREDFLSGLLTNDPPIYGAFLRNAKSLGGHHTRTIRRLCRIESFRFKVSRQALIEFLLQFGSIEVILCDISNECPDSIERIHVIFENQSSLEKLKDSTLSKTNPYFHPENLLTFDKAQEAPFQQKYDKHTMLSNLERKDRVGQSTQEMALLSDDHLLPNDNIIGNQRIASGFEFHRSMKYPHYSNSSQKSALDESSFGLCPPQKANQGRISKRIFHSQEFLDDVSSSRLKKSSDYYQDPVGIYSGSSQELKDTLKEESSNLVLRSWAQKVQPQRVYRDQNQNIQPIKKSLPQKRTWENFPEPASAVIPKALNSILSKRPFKTTKKDIKCKPFSRSKVFASTSPNFETSHRASNLRINIGVPGKKISSLAKPFI